MRRDLRLLAALAALTLLAGALAAGALAREDAAPAPRPPSLVEALLSALLVQERHTERLLDRPGVVGTAVTRTRAGRPAVAIYRTSSRVRSLPRGIGGVPTVLQTVGELRLLGPALRRGAPLRAEEDHDDPEAAIEEPRWPRPVPIGVSVGNADECTAGSIGARVTDGRRVFLLSNNHVLARENAAVLGSDVVQPGPADTYCSTDPEDVLGDLSWFEPVEVSHGPLDPLLGRTPLLGRLDDDLAAPAGGNLVDAAIALTTESELGTATPPDGYGTPLSQTITAEAALGQSVQKYGRSSGLTKGKVVGINGVLEVSYAGGLARFVDQLIVQSPEPFLTSGDSGALLVTDPGRRPAGLLFASNPSGTVALANEIDNVLAAFGVTIDGE